MTHRARDCSSIRSARVRIAHVSLVTFLSALVLGRFFVEDRSTRDGYDFYQFWVVPEVLKHADSANVYDKSERKRLSESYYQRARASGSRRQIRDAQGRRNELLISGTPTLYSFFFHLYGGDYETDYRRHRAIQFGAFFLGLVLMVTTIGLPILTVPLFSALCAGWFSPFTAELRADNVTLLQFGAISTILFLRCRFRRQPATTAFAGFLLGFLVLFKPTTCYFAVALVTLWILKRDKIAIRFGLTFAALGGAVAAIWPMFIFQDAGVWLSWREAVFDVVWSGTTVYRDGSLIGRIVSSPSLLAYQLAGVGALVVIVAAVRSIQARSSNGEGEMEAGLLGILAYFFVAPLIHFYYFVLLIPGILWCLRPSDPLFETAKATGLRVSVALITFSMVGVLPVFFERLPTELSSASSLRGTTIWCYVGAALLFSSVMADVYTRRAIPVGTEPIDRLEAGTTKLHSPRTLPSQ